MDIPGSPVSAKVELKGEVPSNSLGRALDALTDAFSPFTEGMGLIGDHIRVQRFEVAIKIAKRAKELKKESGSCVVPPPLKFTVPFVELSSLEELDGEDAETMQELWAKLLVEACTEFDSQHLTFVRILAELDGAQARFLEGVSARHHRNLILLNTTEMIGYFQREMAEDINSKIQSSELDSNSGFVLTSEAELIADWCMEFVPIHPCKLVSAGIPHRLQIEDNHTFHLLRQQEIATAYILERQGLIRIERWSMPTDIGDIPIELACLTPLGESFVFACGLFNRHPVNADA